ncbi:MAG: MotA/TolQ/ExbB proton channel family protein [Bdellovibrionaceae bacterium]|nr:MotA/TolQ/ExbB proton channel family protein [Bdellovibrionales bacterium]MCB9084734.1 MotA/TolQ/ExbB proton channel family protein [Pseudobdellovibrionaceae bacterium]
MDSIGKMIAEAGTVGFLIGFMGICALALIIERGRVLYFEFAIKTDEFMKQVKSLVMNDQIEEAITFCTANEKAPLAHVVKGVLERSDRDDEGINQGLDIALAEIIPSLGKRLGYLAMIANVATLLGLLGTIQGLIMSFSAVSFADPSQKQVVLAQGISMAMNTTFLGLSVAIPVMVIYAFLHARQNRLLEEISEHSAKVVDWLTTRHYQPFSASGAFPKDLQQNEVGKLLKVEPPPTTLKAS